MSFLLLDECVAKCCSRGATIYTAQRSTAVEGLGYSADDSVIHKYVQMSGCILVTLNGRDFAHLSTQYGPIPAIVLPEVAPRTQHNYLKWVVPIARSTFATHHSKFVEVAATGRAISYTVGQGFRWEMRLPIVSGEVWPTVH